MTIKYIMQIINGRFLPLLVLMFFFHLIQVSAQKANWAIGFPMVTPTPVTILGDDSYIDIYFTPAQANISKANIEVKLPANIKYISTGTGAGHTPDIKYNINKDGTVAAGETIVVNITSNENTLKMGDPLYLRLKVAAQCNAISGENVTVKVRSENTVITDGYRSVQVLVQTPNIRITSANPSQQHTTQTQKKNYSLSLSATNGNVNSLKVTLQADQYSVMENFKLDGVPVTAVKTTTATTTVYTVTLTAAELNTSLGTTEKNLTFDAGATRCGSRMITTQTQFPADAACNTPQTGPVLTMIFPAEAGLPFMKHVSSTHVLPGDFTTPISQYTVCVDGVSPNMVKMVFENSGKADAYDVTASFNRYSAYTIIDIDNVYYQIEGGARKKLPVNQITVTGRLGSSVSYGYILPAFLNKPVSINTKIDEVLPVGKKVTYWIQTYNGKLYDNETKDVYNDYWTITINGFNGNASANNKCGEAGGADQAAVRIAYYGVPHFRELPAPLVLKANETKIQQIRISSGTLNTYGYAEVFIQLPAWMNLDGAIKDAITWRNLGSATAYTPMDNGTNHGNGKYSIKFRTPSTTNSFLYIKYKAGNCPNTTDNLTDKIHYWLNYNIDSQSGTNATCRPALDHISQVFQPVYFLCKKDGIELNSFALQRLTKGLKDSNDDSVPDDGTIAPDNEIRHDAYMQNDEGKMIWKSTIVGTSGEKYNHLYLPVATNAFTVLITGGNVQPDNNNIVLKINGVVSSRKIQYIHHSQIDNNSQFYLYYDASAAPLNASDKIEIELPFKISAATNNYNSLTTECFVSKLPVSDPFNSLTNPDRHGEDIAALPIGTYLIDRLFHWNDNRYVLFDNNNSTELAAGYSDIFHQTKLSSPYFSKEVRRHEYPYRMTWTMPEGYIMTNELKLINDQLDTHSDGSKTIAPTGSTDNGIYVYDIHTLYDLNYNGGTLPVGKWILPDDFWRQSISPTIRATRGAKLGKSTLRRTLIFKNPITGTEFSFPHDITFDYTSEAITLYTSTNTLTAYGPQMNVPSVSIGNPNDKPIKNVWLYVSGNVSNLSITGLNTSGTTSGTGYQGRWIKVSNEMAAAQALNYQLNFTYTGGNNCSGDVIQIYSVSGFDTNWAPITAVALNTTDYDHVGPNRKVAIKSAPARISGALDISDPVLVFDKTYTLEANINTLASQGALKDATVTITVPKGQKYVAGSAKIVYPVGTTAVAVKPALETILTGLNANLTIDRTVSVKLEDALGQPGFMLPGSLADGITKDDQTAIVRIDFKPQCETSLTGIRFTGVLSGNTSCGNTAVGSGYLLASRQMFSSVSGDYTFDVAVAVKDNNLSFNEVLKDGVLKVTIKKTSSYTSNMDLTDLLSVSLPKSMNINGTATITSIIAGASGNATVTNNVVAGNVRNIQFLLPVAAFNEAPDKGMGKDVVFEIPVQYTPDGQVLATNPVQTIDAVVQTIGKFHASCPGQPNAIGNGSKDIALLTAQDNPAYACLNTPVTLKITSSGFSGKWYRKINKTEEVSATDSYVYTPDLQQDVNFYVSAIFNGLDFGVVPVAVKMFPQVVSDFTANQVCLGATTNFTNKSTVGGVAANATNVSKWEWFKDGEVTAFSTVQNPDYLFTTEGTHTVHLKVTSKDGCVHQSKLDVIVNPLPFVSFTIDQASACVSVPITFTDHSTISGGNIASQAWNFGDATTGTGSPVTHAYTTAGDKTVTLTVKSDKNCESSYTSTITVRDLPTAVISGDATICSGAATNLTITLTGTAPWTVVYNDGSTNKTITGITTASHTFTVSPATTTTYTLVSVTDANCTKTLSGSATVDVLTPVVNGIPDQVFCIGATPTIPLHGTPGTLYHWTGGAAIGLTDGSSTTAIPSFIATTGSSTITVTPEYTSATGITCLGTAKTFKIDVHLKPMIKPTYHVPNLP